jgi:phosphate transport system substrate-binding protein
MGVLTRVCRGLMLTSQLAFFNLSFINYYSVPALSIGDSLASDTSIHPRAVQLSQNLNVSLFGAGSSFQAPLYQSWARDFTHANQGVQINYQAVGSGNGIEQFFAGVVDFVGSDSPLRNEDRDSFIKRYGAAPIQVPIAGGSIVFAYNLANVPNLRLSRTAYCGIVTGEITTWNDPTIAATNSDVVLPNRAIRFVHRSDRSGTTVTFSDHLAKACPNWTGGISSSINWQVGTGALGNEGVTAQVKQIPGAIGYVESSYATFNDLPKAAIENKSGNIISPTPEAASLAFEDEIIPADFALFVSDPNHPDAYPIVSLTWLLLYPHYDDPAKAQMLKSFVNFALTTGRATIIRVDYIPLGDNLAQEVRNAVAKIEN